MCTQENLLKRIDELLNLQWNDGQGYDVVGEVYAGTIAIASQIWGSSSAQVEAVKQLREDIQASTPQWGAHWSEITKAGNIVGLCQGALRSIASDIKAGRLGSIRLEYQGQVFADLVNAAKAAMAEGTKDVAAVLAATALEDTLKRYAHANGLDIEDRDLSTVVNALKAAGLLSATQGTLVKGMVPFRNKALHAEWAKIGTEEVQGVLAFVEEFLARRFA
jgi:uncharacterized protein YutE (UPF0331/DUF86 family)